MQKIIKNIATATKYLKSGHLVAFPTETVYGLGADANNPLAIQKVFAAKGRPTNHPLIVHLASASELIHWAQDVPEDAKLLAAAFWPGPLTMILTKQEHVSPLITGGQNTIAIRVPNHPLALELLTMFGSGLVGPSANIYGHVSPTTAAHVVHDLGDAVSAVLDGGPCTIGIESTIVYLNEQTTTIMRQGVISADQISAVLHKPVAINVRQNSELRTSGSHAAHYAPRTPLFVDSLENIIKSAQQSAAQTAIVTIISFAAKPANLNSQISWLQVDLDPASFGKNFYAQLRNLDSLQLTAIFIEQPPQTPAWAAINDRLTRACAKHQK